MPFHEEKASQTSLQVCNMLSFSNFQTGYHKNKQIIHFLTKHLKGLSDGNLTKGPREKFTLCLFRQILNYLSLRPNTEKCT